MYQFVWEGYGHENSPTERTMRSVVQKFGENGSNSDLCTFS